MIFGPPLFGGNNGDITFVASAVAGANSVTSLTVAAPAGAQGGDLIVLVVSSNFAEAPNSIPAGFTTASSTLDGGALTVLVGPFVAGTSNYTVGFSSARGIEMSALAYRNPATFSVSAVGAAAAISSGSPITAPSLNVPSRGVLLAAFGAINGGLSFGAGPAGMTLRAQTPNFSSPNIVYDLNPANAGASGTKSQAISSGYFRAYGVLLSLG